VATNPHQYICDGEVMDETLFGDRIVGFLYSNVRENSPQAFKALTGKRASWLLGYLNFDMKFAPALLGNKRFLKKCGVDLSECADFPATLDTPRKVFERKIRFWECRPMAQGDGTVVSPADSRVLIGSLSEHSGPLFIKGKFFTVVELFGIDRDWNKRFQDGQFGIFRLTPDFYHWNHTPVAGIVADFYEIDGTYHSCNPNAVVTVATPYSKNKRVITIINTDVPGGTAVGYVAMVEIVALMIGEVVQCYSEERYENPQKTKVGDFVKKGCVKSLYRPGSSTDILFFERNRVRFPVDLITNRLRNDAKSRFTEGFGANLVETQIKVRAAFAEKKRCKRWFLFLGCSRRFPL
jgi:phosphatidylserine decarboxylase